MSKRERQIVEAIYRLKTASAAEVRAGIPDPPGYSAVRATLQILVGKGLLTHRRDGRRYVYAPTIPHRQARQSAVQHLVSTYFDGSVTAAVAALLNPYRTRLSDTDHRKLLELIRKSEMGTRP
ncbi:MAG: BlaI/MecI/CopY family transcriptional regulator [Spirochaetes bacterium]|nr:BlaI/MecI/CopY family transcriptional regulator [Spirochaetota bacterium]